MLKIVTYTMYLITVTDIETANVEVHRLVFDNHKECVARQRLSIRYETQYLQRRIVVVCRISGFAMKPDCMRTQERQPLCDAVEVVFTTGREKTYDFVQRCSDEWGVPVTWLEYRVIRDEEKNKNRHTFEIVHGGLVRLY